MNMFRLSWLLSFLASLLLTGFIVVALLYVYLENQLPDVSELKDMKLQAPLQVYTNDGKLIGEFGPIRRAPVNYEQIPPLFIKALLATEDQRFFEHPGVDVYGLLRAAVHMAMTGTKSEGGSTITMQVARNFYLTRQKTFSRKLQEILLALKIDQQVSKEKILELYLNKIYFGQQAYGIAAAAQAYYGKTLDQLTLPEIAMLAGLPQAPSAINPINNPGAAKIRRDHVLSRMLELKEITKAQYDAAINTPLSASYHGRRVQVWAPYAGEMVRGLMASTYGDDAFTHSYKVYTTISSDLQVDANQAVRNGLLAYDRRHGYRGIVTHVDNIEKISLPKLENYLKLIPYANGLRPGIVMPLSQENQNKSIPVLVKDAGSIALTSASLSWTGKRNFLRPGDVIWVNELADHSWQLAQIPEAQSALVSLNPNSGGIIALVGGFDFRLSNFNRAVQAQRQPGSGFKPFIYSAALDNGYTLASTFSNEPIVLPDPSSPDGEWRPQNDESDWDFPAGPIRVRVALAKSLNLPSIRVLQAIGVENTVNYISRFGFDPKQMPHNMSIALGTPSFTPLQLANAFSVFANGGYRVNPYIIQKVVDSNDKTVFEFHSAPPQRVLSPETDFLMVDVLKTVIEEGTASKALSLGRKDLAGKTGTSNDEDHYENDAWFNGFNSDVETTVWVGFDQHRPIKEYGAKAALPIWIDYMTEALKNKPEHTVSQPTDIVSVKIDPATGFLARPDQNNAIFEYFTQDTVPQEEAPTTMSPAGAGTSSDTGEPIF
jgi:penicillin-binding protein 1A